MRTSPQRLPTQGNMGHTAWFAACSLFVALSACGEPADDARSDAADASLEADAGSADGSSDSGPQGTLHHEHELSAGTKRAGPGDVVLVHLEAAHHTPHGDDSGKPGVDHIPYRFTTSASYTTCLARRGGVMHTMRLVRDDSGDVVFDLTEGGCAGFDVTAGDYTLEFTHATARGAAQSDHPAPELWFVHPFEAVPPPKSVTDTKTDRPAVFVDHCYGVSDSCCMNCDFSGKDLRGHTFGWSGYGPRNRYVQMQGAHFEGADLRGARFIAGDVWESDHGTLYTPGTEIPALGRAAKVMRTDECNLELTHWEGANLGGAEFVGCSFALATFDQNTLVKNTRFVGVSMPSAQGVPAAIFGAEAELTRSDLCGALNKTPIDQLPAGPLGGQCLNSRNPIMLGNQQIRAPYDIGYPTLLSAIVPWSALTVAAWQTHGANNCEAVGAYVDDSLSGVDLGGKPLANVVLIFAVDGDNGTPASTPAFDHSGADFGGTQATFHIQAPGAGKAWGFAKADFSGCSLLGPGGDNTPSLAKADLTGAKLTDTKMVQADLRQAKLDGAHLAGADLSGADLSGASLVGADLTGADLSYAKLTGADLSGAKLGGARLCAAVLDGAKLGEADLSNAALTGASLKGADLSHATLDDARLTRAAATQPRCATTLGPTNLSGANLAHASLKRVEASEAVVAGALFSWADLTDAHLNLLAADTAPTLFSWALLRRVDLTSANLRGAQLQHADLSGGGSTLTDAHFEGANLANARLGHVQAVGANFSGAVLDGAALDHALLDNAHFDANGGLAASLTKAWLCGASLVGTSFVSANLAGAAFPAQATQLPGPPDDQGKVTVVSCAAVDVSQVKTSSKTVCPSGSWPAGGAASCGGDDWVAPLPPKQCCHGKPILNVPNVPCTSNSACMPIGGLPKGQYPLCLAKACHTLIVCKPGLVKGKSCASKCECRSHSCVAGKCQ